MTRAERMRMIAENAEKENQIRLKDKHTKYCHRLVETKIRRAANRGKKECKIKLRKPYIGDWIIEILTDEKFGFLVISSVVNGRYILEIGW